MPAVSQVRNDWSRAEVLTLFALPFTELLHRAGTVHRDTSIPPKSRSPRSCP
jgi:biotin synthase